MSAIARLIDDLVLDTRLDAVEAADRHLAPDFRQRVNGDWLDRDAFLAGMAELRAAGDRIEVTVLDEIRDGQRYAERHVITRDRDSGERVATEVFVFASLTPDGRFACIDEASVVLPALESR